MKTLTLSILVFAAAPIFGGTLIQSQSKQLPGNAVQQREMLLEDNRFRMNDGNTSILFHQVNGQWVMDILDKSRNEVRRMDEAFINQMSQTMAGANAQMEAAMAKMDPQQKAMMAQVMKGKLGAIAGGTQAAAPTVYTAAGNATVSGFACREYEGRRANQLVARVCAAQISALNLPASRYQVFARMREFSSKLQAAAASGPMGNMIPNVAETGFDGFPVRTTRLTNGQPSLEDTVTAITEKAFTDADFSTGNAKVVPMQAPNAKGK